MIAKGKFKFKSIEEKSGGEFVNSQGQKIKYDGSYSIKVDEITDNGIYERRFKVNLNENSLISKLKQLNPYTDVEITFYIQFYGNSTKVVPTDIISCNNK